MLTEFDRITIYYTLMQILQSVAVDNDLLRMVRDDRLDTCALVSDSSSAKPWYADFSLPIMYWNKPGNVDVTLIGENLGCSIADDGKLYLFPISSWDDSTSVSWRRETCHFVESSVTATAQQQCVYGCNYTTDSIALRVMRWPIRSTQLQSSLCDVSNIFFVDTACIVGPLGGSGGVAVSTEDCWIEGGRMFPTGFTFLVNDYLWGFDIEYGNFTCHFGGWTDQVQIVTLANGELINEVRFYRDLDGVYNQWQTVVGLKFTTNLGNVYGPFGPFTAAEYVLSGEELLYFFGRSGLLIDAIGAQFGKC